MGLLMPGRDVYTPCGVGCCWTGCVASRACPCISYPTERRSEMAESKSNELTILCFLIGRGRMFPVPAFAFMMPGLGGIPPFGAPFAYPFPFGSPLFAACGFPCACAPPFGRLSSRSLFFPRCPESTSMGVLGRAPAGVPVRCCCRPAPACLFADTADPGRGTVEPGRGTADLGLATPGRGTPLKFPAVPA